MGHPSPRIIGKICQTRTDNLPEAFCGVSDHVRYTQEAVIDLNILYY